MCVVKNSCHYGYSYFRKQNKATYWNVECLFIHIASLDSTVHYKTAMAVTAWRYSRAMSNVTTACTVQMAVAFLVSFLLGKGVPSENAGWLSDGNWTLEQHLIGLLQPWLAQGHQGTHAQGEKAFLRDGITTHKGMRTR